VMRRVGQARYPIDVVKVPLETPLTVAFTAISKRLIESDMPKELSAALKNQLRIHLKR
ncbi:phage tail protein, partial [Enterobacter cloacae]